MTRLIGLCGLAGAGKDAAASYLVREHGFVKASFADPLRELVYRTDLAVQEFVDAKGWDRAKREHSYVRRALQDVGLAVRDIIGEDTWVDLAMRKSAEHGNVVISDVRFPNEAAAILATVGGEIWRITRPGLERVNDHVSENGVPNDLVTKVVANDGLLGDLGFKVHWALR